MTDQYRDLKLSVSCPDGEPLNARVRLVDVKTGEILGDMRGLTCLSIEANADSLTTAKFEVFIDELAVPMQLEEAKA